MPDIKSINAGKAVIEFVGDDRNLRTALVASQTRLEKFATAATNIGSRLNIVGQYMLTPFRQSVGVFAQFDDAMRSVRAVTSASAADFASLAKQARDLGASTSFTAQQVAEGMASLGRMGFDPTAIQGSIAAMMDLSRSTGTDLAAASQIAANNMAVFGINASQTSKVADILALTANSSAQSLEDLGEALKTAGPFAQQAGQNLEQASAALGVLANMGIRGSMAGTALAKTYKQLADPKVREYLQTMFDIDPTDGNGNLRDTAAVLAEIGHAVSGLGSAEQIQALEKIFDARGALGGGVLSMNVNGIDEMLAKFSQLEGYAKNASAETDQGLGGSLRRLGSAFEGVSIAVGDAIDGALKPCITVLEKVLSVIKELVEANPVITTAVAGIAALTAGIGGTLATLGGLIGMGRSIASSIQSVIAALASMSTATSAATAATGTYSVSAAEIGRAHV